jgi:hypothetical protein
MAKHGGGRTRVVSRGGKPPKSGVKKPAKTQFQKELEAEEKKEKKK